MAHNQFSRGNSETLSSNASNATLNSDDEAEIVHNPRKRQRKISSALKDPSFETDELPFSLQSDNFDFDGTNLPLQRPQRLRGKGSLGVEDSRVRSSQSREVPRPFRGAKTRAKN